MASGGGVTSEMALVVSWHRLGSCPLGLLFCTQLGQPHLQQLAHGPRPLPVGLERLPGPTSCCPIPQQHQHVVGVGS